MVGDGRMRSSERCSAMFEVPVTCRVERSNRVAPVHDEHRRPRIR